MIVAFLRGIEPLKVEIEKYDKQSDTIVYHVSGTPICQYDQHSRARIGVEFYNYEVSNSPTYVFYTKVFDLLSQDKEFDDRVSNTLLRLEERRNEEEHLPQEFNLMSRACSYSVKQSWGSLIGQMSRRLKFCEEEFIVGLHWKLRHELMNMGIEKAVDLLPGCDRGEECDYSSADYLSNLFGCLFAGCGRWPDKADFASFNESCTTPEMIEEQLGITIPKSRHELLQVENG